jgi:hypothetical protein
MEERGGHSSCFGVHQESRLRLRGATVQQIRVMQCWWVQYGRRGPHPEGGAVFSLCSEKSGNMAEVTQPVCLACGAGGLGYTTWEPLLPSRQQSRFCRNAVLSWLMPSFNTNPVMD